MAHLFISAAHKSSGKTTVALGLCAALKARGLDVQPFKKGPDYIDPMWLTRASGRPCHNLDFYTMDRDEILAAAASHISSADIGIVEGNKGLYDGLDLDGSNSNAALASLLSAPVILVLDARGMTRGIAPLILGYQAFDETVNIAAVILNQLGGSRHEAKLRKVIEHYTDVSVVGAIGRDPELEIVERHLGLIPSNEAREARDKIAKIGDIVGAQVDLEGMLTIAEGAPRLASMEGTVADVATGHAPDVRIGLARDSAFGFYYPDDLLALERAGAELVPFEPLTSAELPGVDGLFLGGGFPETRMHELEQNSALRASIRAAIENGLPCYAECGGLMYLARSLSWRQQRCEMVGIIPADVVMHNRPQGRGYVRLKERTALWPEGVPDGEIAAHEFHYSSLENLDSGAKFAYEVLRGTGIDGQHDGLMYKNLLACYTHQRDTRQNRWAGRFVSFVRQVKQSRGGNVAAIP